MKHEGPLRPTRAIYVMSKAKHTLAMFLLGLGEVLTDAGKALDRKEPAHPMYEPNEALGEERAQ